MESASTMGEMESKKKRRSAAAEALNFGGERIGGERAGGEDGDAVEAGERGDFLAHHADQRLGGDGLGGEAAELQAVDGQGVSGGNAGAAGHLHQQRSGVAHLLLEQPGRGVFAVALERVGADEFGEQIGLMGGGVAQRAHLVERDGETAAGALPCSLGTGKARADDANGQGLRVGLQISANGVSAGLRHVRDC